MTSRRLCVLVVLVGLAQGCAGARLRRATVDGLREADALAARGCHACLVDALAIYERLTPKEPVQRQLVDRRVIRTSLLLALRAKELGLPAQPHLARAKTRIGPSPTEADRERLELAEALPSNPAGLSREQQDDERGRLAASRPRIDARLAQPRGASDDPELDAYLDLTLVCTARGQLPKGVTVDALVPAGPARPLLEYRLGACGLDKETHLDAALAAEPRFDEVHLFTGRYRLLAGRGGAAGRPPIPAPRKAVEALTKAHAAFPESVAVLMELANATRLRSYRDALPLYDRVLARVPGHHDALLYKGMCESYLGRHTDAVATFTQLTALGRWLVGEAHYWRAWNRHQLKELDAAWADVETAKQTLYNADLYTLAGVIAYDRQQLDVARTHLEKGLELQPRMCTAAWYLGLVHAAQERWPAAGDTFITASACYRQDADDGRHQLAEAEATKETEENAESRASQIAAARAAIAESQRQEALSAYNAAYGFVRAQQIDRARPLLAAARQHADVKGRADELIAYVDRP